MNAQLGFVANRQFWTGVVVAIIAAVLVGIGLPRYAYRAKRVASIKTDSLRLEGGGGGGDRVQVMGYLSSDESPAYDDQRKMIRNASMDLIVRRPKEASDSIRKFAEEAGGFLVSAEAYGGEDAASASLTIRVPVNKFEEVRGKIVKLGLRIQSEKLEAQDVTKQYVDLSARLKNLRAQEGQYLGILKQARTVKDTVEVSDKLNEVRSQIEQQQAEFDVLSKQVETVALAVSLHAKADVRVFGLQWRPLYRLKEAARDGIDNIGDYTSAMASFIFFIPALLLWIATILVGAALTWKLLRWARRTLFASKTTKV